MVGVGAAPHRKQRYRNEHGSSGFDAARAADASAYGDKCLTLLSALPADVALPLAQSFLQRFAAVELDKTAELKRNGASDRHIRKQASAGGTRTKKAATRASKRADAVNLNPDLANDVGAGELGEEQLDAIANASDKTDGDAATDPELIDDIKNSPADDAGKITSRWLERRDDDNAAKTRYQRQRAKRFLKFGYDPHTGCETMTAGGDRETITAIRKLVRSDSNGLYEKDGGRDLPADQHPRTRTQRDFDALHQLITQNSTATTNNDSTGTGTTSRGNGTGVGTATSDTTAKPKRTTPPVRSMIHITTTVDDLVRDQIKASCVGGDGLLPDTVVDHLACGSVIAGTVFSQQGETLWHGRHKRHATPAQHAALIARDQGCVLCGADPEHCEAHHLNPWTSPARGETNIDDMALVCGDDHHWIHEHHQTLTWQLGPPNPQTGIRSRVWTTRPATPDELPTRGDPSHAA